MSIMEAEDYIFVIAWLGLLPIAILSMISCLLMMTIVKLHGVDIAVNSAVLSRLGHCTVVVMAVSMGESRAHNWSYTSCIIAQWIWLSSALADILTSVLFLALISRRSAIIRQLVYYACMAAFVTWSVSLLIGGLPFFADAHFRDNYDSNAPRGKCLVAIARGTRALWTTAAVVYVIASLLCLLLATGTVVDKPTGYPTKSLAVQTCANGDENIAEVKPSTTTHIQKDACLHKNGEVTHNGNASTRTARNQKHASAKLQENKYIIVTIAMGTVLLNTMPQLVICSIGATNEDHIVHKSHEILLTVGLVHATILPWLVCLTGTRYRRAMKCLYRELKCTRATNRVAAYSESNGNTNTGASQNSNSEIAIAPSTRASDSAKEKCPSQHSEEAIGPTSAHDKQVANGTAVSSVSDTGRDQTGACPVDIERCHKEPRCRTREYLDCQSASYETALTRSLSDCISARTAYVVRRLSTYNMEYHGEPTSNCGIDNDSPTASDSPARATDVAPWDGYESWSYEDSDSSAWSNLYDDWDAESDEARAGRRKSVVSHRHKRRRSSAISQCMLKRPVGIGSLQQRLKANAKSKTPIALTALFPSSWAPDTFIESPQEEEGGNAVGKNSNNESKKVTPVFSEMCTQTEFSDLNDYVDEVQTNGQEEFDANSEQVMTSHTPHDHYISSYLQSLTDKDLRTCSIIGSDCYDQQPINSDSNWIYESEAELSLKQQADFAQDLAPDTDSNEYPRRGIVTNPFLEGYIGSSDVNVDTAEINPFQDVISSGGATRSPQTDIAIFDALSTNNTENHAGAYTSATVTSINDTSQNDCPLTTSSTVADTPTSVSHITGSTARPKLEKERSILRSIDYHEGKAKAWKSAMVALSVIKLSALVGNSNQEEDNDEDNDNEFYDNDF